MPTPNSLPMVFSGADELGQAGPEQTSLVNESRGLYFPTLMGLAHGVSPEATSQDQCEKCPE